MSFRIIATAGGFNLAPGTYSAVVKAVEPDESSFNNEGSTKFTFTVADGDEVQEPWAWSSQKLSPASKLWRWIETLTGESPITGEDYVIESLVGRQCRLRIGTREDMKGEVHPAVLDILPAANPTQSAPSAAENGTGCLECSGPLGADGYFTADGKPYCGKHGPRSVAS